MKQKKQNIARILYLHNKSEISGGERSLLNLWSNLNKKKYKPYLVIPSKGQFGDEANKQGVEILNLCVPKLNLRNIKRILQCIITLRRYIIVNKINIIHSYTPRNNILGAFAGKISGVPIIWHERNLIFGKEKDISKRFMLLPEIIICNSAAVAERFKKKNRMPNKVQTILNGVDVSKFLPGRASHEILHKYNLNGKKVVGLISNFSKRKTPELLFYACQNIINKCPNVVFVVVGDEFGKDDIGRKDELICTIKRLGIENYIVLTGFITDIREIVKAFDIGVAVTKKEACSRAILEMMASGKPVVAFDTGGNSEIIENNVTGKLVKFGDILAMAKSISILLNDDAKRDSFGKYARRVTEAKFDIKINTLKTEKIYSELLKF